jgi:hypothetical protein
VDLSARPVPREHAALIVPLVGAAVFLYVGVFRPSITLADSELVIRNVWRTHRIAADDIVRAEAGHFGIAVQTRDGREVRGWAVQKPNLARWKRPSSRLTAQPSRSKESEHDFG